MEPMQRMDDIEIVDVETKSAVSFDDDIEADLVDYDKLDFCTRLDSGRKIFGMSRFRWRLCLFLWGLFICGIYPALADSTPLMPNIIVALVLEATRNSMFFASVIFLYSGDRQFLEESLLFYCLACIWLLTFDVVVLHDIVHTIDSTIILYTANMTLCAFLITKWNINNPNGNQSQSVKTIFILLLMPVAFITIVSHMCVVFIFDGINQSQ